MSTLKVNTVQHNTSGFNNVVQFTDGAGTQNGTLCRAWVNFNGSSTVAIRASFNVGSITDNGTGDYTVNFSNALSDANYSVSFGGQSISGSGWWRFLGSGYSSGNGYAAGSYRFQTPTYNMSVVDTDIATLHFFR